MPERGDNDEVENDATESSAPVGGERLAAARREQQISVLEVAKELHLDEPKVRALERNEFDVLGAPVFAKGHLRKYAQLVGVDEDDLFTDYFKLNRAQPMPPIVIGRTRQRQELSPGPWIAAVVIILVAVAAYWWFAVRTVSDVPLQDGPPAGEQPAPFEQLAVNDDSAVLAAADSGERPTDGGIADLPIELPSEVAAETIVVATDSEPAGQSAEPVSAVADGQVRLELSFSGECWTEISDADGRRLFFGMGQAGRETSVTGAAPVSALFGNAENVSLRVNGSPYSFDAAERRGRTARLSIPDS